MSDVTVIVKTKGADQAAKEIKDVGDAAEKAHGPIGKMGGALADVGKVAGGFVVGEGIVKLGGFLSNAAKAAAEDEQSTARLSATIKSLGGDFDSQMAKVQAAIKHGQDLAFTDDEVRDSFDKLAQATGDSDEALKRQALAMDLARGANIPLADASKLLGKVTDENLQVFKRMGITLPDVANEADVLAAVQAKFAGQSTAYANSTAGQFEQTKIRMSELKESIGAQLLPVMTKIGEVLLTEVVPKLEQFANWWSENAQPKIEAFVAAVMPKIEEFAAFAGKQFAKFQDFYESDIKPAFDNIVAGVTYVVEQFRSHWNQIEPFVRPVFIMIETAMNTLQAAIKIVLDLIAGDWDGVWQGIKNLVAGIFDGIVALGGAFKDQIVAVFNGAKDLITGIDWLQLGKDIIQFIIDGVVSLTEKAGSEAKDLFFKAKDKILEIDWLQLGKDIIQKAIDGYLLMGETLWEGIKKLFGKAKDAIMNIDWWQVGADIIKWAKQGLEDMAWSIIDAAGSIAGKIGDKVNPLNWKGSPIGIQNWYPYYFKIGMANLAAEAETNPDLERIREIVKKKLDVSTLFASGGGAGMTGTSATPPGGVTPPGMIWQYIGGGQYGFRPYNDLSIDKYGSSYQGGKGTQNYDPSLLNYQPTGIKDMPGAYYDGTKWVVNLHLDGNLLATTVSNNLALGY